MGPFVPEKAFIEKFLLKIEKIKGVRALILTELDNLIVIFDFSYL